MIPACEPDGKLNISVRSAAEKDAAELKRLNALFNGVRDVGAEAIALSIRNNDKEQVFVAEYRDGLVGFCCVRSCESFCYKSNYAEITELFVEGPYRRKGVATRLIAYAENYYSKRNIAGFLLLTGRRNTFVQKFYESVGYTKTEEIMYRKKQCHVK